MNHHYSLLLSILISLFFAQVVKTQTYTDYFGNGHSIGMTVSSSHQSSGNIDDHALAGSGHHPDEKGASRFLAQATMGSNYEAIQNVVSIGIEDWLENQFSLIPSSFESEYYRIYNEAIAIINNDEDKDEYMGFTFYEKLIKDPDVLRQKVAFALSQIFVISPTNSLLTNRGFANANYYDALYLGAFGNFHDLLYNVTLHPCMGVYLSHLQNQKSDLVQGTLPDENYAREIMQLFSIGLYELNQDGSYKYDNDGNLIPTYGIQDIQELARVFTGLSGSSRLDGEIPLFQNGIGAFDLAEPMAMYYDYHDKRSKVILGNTILPPDQLGTIDIEQTVEILFNHPNVAPFIGRRLIQHLVKSNPSPQYIFRVSSVFNDDGTGTRGNLKAVIKAVLTDPEARDCSWIDDLNAGKLIQPVQRLTNLFLAFDIYSPSNKFWFNDKGEIYDKLGQSFLASPTVFNFFSPFYSEKDYAEPNGIVSPEFQILNATSGMYYLNEVENRTKIRPFKNRTLSNAASTGLDENTADPVQYDFNDEISIYQTEGLHALIDRIDLLVCRGQLEQDIKDIIFWAVNENIQNESDYTEIDIINDVLYFMMITPNYTILK